MKRKPLLSTQQQDPDSSPCQRREWFNSWLTSNPELSDTLINMKLSYKKPTTLSLNPKTPECFSRNPQPQLEPTQTRHKSCKPYENLPYTPQALNPTKLYKTPYKEPSPLALLTTLPYRPFKPCLQLRSPPRRPAKRLRLSGGRGGKGRGGLGFGVSGLGFRIQGRLFTVYGILDDWVPRSGVQGLRRVFRAL